MKTSLKLQLDEARQMARAALQKAQEIGVPESVVASFLDRVELDAGGG